jgi:hypothetical protein
MYHVFFFLLVAVLFVCTRLIGGRWYFGYLLGGLAFGMYNEICFEFCWDYSQKLSPMIWRDVPLVVILGWGIETGIALALSNRLREWRGWTNQWITHALDIGFFSILGYCTETLMSVMKFWSYNNPLLAVWWAQIMGYVFVGLIVSSTGRMLQNLLDKKLNPCTMASK